MENLIKYVVACDTLYGVIALAILFLGFIAIGLITYKIIRVALPYIYKMICKICNAVKKYKQVHTKIKGKESSAEIDLHQ